MEFNELKESILACRDCAEKFGHTPSPIFHGTQHSKIMQISQAPSKNVHLTKRPFNDPSGDKLKYQWYQITDDEFYNEDNFYITSIAHCFPGKNGKGGDKPPPLSCAKKWMATEMSFVDNKIFVIIGAKAANYLFPGIPFIDLVFNEHILGDKPTYVMPHPSPLNVRWFKEHPAFEEQRLPVIRAKVWEALGKTE
ncbi:uracil-DNA glycosylase family protein [Paenibacillus sp. PR3]|uniref:Uracil-DNA glycosylase family protein n=1 Tax=Paenibacillus terricola TaxID=2763503 RepID=A0ABR8MU20_9BACL|nr:uracil-DNA glycosylase family protein [Paenibacillus terricola]MBD3919460.1 uracil-DNA glycosylase family protein [Paenibacillus terricola]